MPPAIRVERLSKRYRLGKARTDGYRTLRETIVEAASAPWRRLRRNRVAEPRAEDFWALKDVSFEVQPGEVVGIIGRNGAGKSTLLKILSQITEPTSGRVELRGRVGSLLEVGTGFHPELTGRENIYLNGSILGMSRREITRRFDEIVEFAEIELFLDTPVKRYSSGMYVRLAFAVAAHLEPEILIVDEVLAVGDPFFQKKCLGKMGEVSRLGLTVLFVSHNIAAIEALCGQCLLLNQGRLIAGGESATILARYQELSPQQLASRQDLTCHPGRTGGSSPMMSEVVLLDRSGVPSASFRMGSKLSVSVDFNGRGRPIRPVLGVELKTGRGTVLFGVNNRFIPGYVFDPNPSDGSIACHVDALPLMPGLYTLSLYLGDEHRDWDVIHDAISFEVEPSDVFGSGKLPPSASGPFYWRAAWDAHAHQLK